MSSKIIRKRAKMLAPMAGYTRYPFRALVAKYGADITVTELVNVRGLYEYIYTNKNNPTTLELIFTDKNEPMAGLQLFGSDSEFFGVVVKELPALFPSYKFFDLNLGCPSKTVTRAGAGAALLKKPEKIRSIINTVTKFSSLPITIKTRLGWSEFTLPMILKIANEYDIEFVSVHLRYATENYNTPAHKELIDDIINISDMPIIANGDIFSIEDEEYYFSKGATGVAIGRWAKSNPLVFSDIKQPSIKEKKKVFEEFMNFYENMCNIASLPQSFPFIKRFAINLVKGSHGARDIKLAIHQTKNLQELGAIFNTL